MVLCGEFFFFFFCFFCFLGFLFWFWVLLAGLWFGVDLLGFWVFFFIYIYILVVLSLSELKIYAVLSRRGFNFWWIEIM